MGNRHVVVVSATVSAVVGLVILTGSSTDRVERGIAIVLLAAAALLAWGAVHPNRRSRR